MSETPNNYLTKLRHAMPWLVRYPFVRAKSMWQAGNANLKKHIIITVANHFEPSWKPVGMHDLDTQLRRLDDWHRLAAETGDAVRDADGTKFRHTNFFPAEQYHPAILSQMAAMQAEGLGDVEVHLHHGVEKPDTSENLRSTLIEFRDRLAEEHKLLSRSAEFGDLPMYAFVHGNLALANSAGGRFCGVDDEMRILQETGCYVDMTLPSAPDETQVPVINKIYEYGLPPEQRSPHRTGKSVRINGNQPQLPLIFTGPLIFNWTRRVKRIVVPRIEDGVLDATQALDLARFERWRKANITVEGRADWIFVKLYCHGFFDQDQSACIGDDARRFFSEIIEHGEKTGDYQIHFATAREAFNMVVAAIDGESGSPNDFRDYRLKAIMNERQTAAKNSPERVSAN